MSNRGVVEVDLFFFEGGSSVSVSILFLFFSWCCLEDATMTKAISARAASLRRPRISWGTEIPWPPGDTSSTSETEATILEVVWSDRPPPPPPCCYLRLCHGLWETIHLPPPPHRRILRNRQSCWAGFQIDRLIVLMRCALYAGCMQLFAVPQEQYLYNTTVFIWCFVCDVWV